MAKELKNLKVINTGIRVAGAAYCVGDIIAKDAFPNKASWQNLLHMAKPRVEETDDAVGKAKPKAKAKPALPGA